MRMIFLLFALAVCDGATMFSFSVGRVALAGRLVTLASSLMDGLGAGRVFERDALTAVFPVAVCGREKSGFGLFA